jgi:hypothetical protein
MPYPVTWLLSSELLSDWVPQSRKHTLTVRPAARVFKLAPGGPSVLETTLSPGTRLEIDATDIVVAVAATVAVGRSCMQEVQGDPQTEPWLTSRLGIASKPNDSTHYGNIHSSMAKALLDL